MSDSKYRIKKEDGELVDVDNVHRTVKNADGSGGNSADDDTTLVPDPVTGEIKRVKNKNLKKNEDGSYEDKINAIVPVSNGQSLTSKGEKFF